MKIAISSGKGGTGKTLIATNLAAVAAARGSAVTYLDCDVEAPNGHLFLGPEFHAEAPVTVKKPVAFDPQQCNACGRCVSICRYNALALIRDEVMFFPELCHACGACSLACARGCVEEGATEVGRLRHGTARGAIDFHDGLLQTGAGGMSPRLIKALKRYAGKDLTLLDSPPGTSCAPVETVRDADLCVLVADPTPFALHDLKLSVVMCREAGHEPVVIVNRAGRDSTALRTYCREAHLEILGEIPEDRAIAEAYSRGEVVVDVLPHYRPQFEQLLNTVLLCAAEPRWVRGGHAAQAPVSPGAPAKAPRRPEAASRPPELAVVSGKGGTGKTSIAACFAQLAEDGTVADCDVDAADLHLLLQPEPRETGDFVGGMVAEIDPEACTACGRCRSVCRFDAVRVTPAGAVTIDPTRCEGCGACELVCEDLAIESSPYVGGQWCVSSTRFGAMAHAVLGASGENSGKLVSLVREKATDHASAGPVVMDGSPGTGCPVIASVTGARYAVVVTEPTVSGQHDLMRILELTRHFRVPAGVIVNKADLNPEISGGLLAVAREYGAELLGELPFDPAFTEAQIVGQTLLEHGASPTAEALRALWTRIQQKLSIHADGCTV